VDENVELIQRVEECWDQGDLDALDDLFAADFVSHAGVDSRMKRSRTTE
jgi:ketosteroid isomerase-like protein